MAIHDDRTVKPDRLSIWLMRHWGSIGYVTALCVAVLLLWADGMIVLWTSVIAFVTMANPLPVVHKVVMVALPATGFLITCAGLALLVKGWRRRRARVVAAGLAVLAVPVAAMFAMYLPNYNGLLGAVLLGALSPIS
jgi:hypothetical protein